MKKTWLTLTLSMVFVLVLSVFGGKFLLPLIMAKTSSQTACLTQQITDEMDVYDIAKLYRDNRATVAVIVEGKNIEDKYIYRSLGSGVCIASRGYETKSLDVNIIATYGSYLVTNYHVIDMMFSDEYVNKSIKVLTEGDGEYSASLLWSNKSLDIAVLYCNQSFNYVEMRDRIIYPTADDKIDYEPIFTIGTPLDLQYLNRLTRGDIACDNLMELPNLMYVTDPDENSVVGLYNMYEDVVDISVGITNGNSGGGCFDEEGVLLGLTTLGLGVGSTGGNQMNGMVPVYPVIEVIDKLVSNKEKGTTMSIHTVESLGILGFDAHEADIVSYCYETEKEIVEEYSYYYFNGEFFDNENFADDFGFNREGYYILRNSTGALGGISNASVVNSISINGGPSIRIKDRNDFIYALLQIDDGDKVVLTYLLGSYPEMKIIQF